MVTFTTFLIGGLAIYATGSVVYLLVFSVAGLFRQQERFHETHVLFRIVVLVPAYREDSVIVSTVEALIDQDFPHNSFEVVVIADTLSEDTLGQLRRLQVTIVETDDEQRTKAKALQAGLSILEPDEFDVAVVMDADNQVARDFLPELNRAFQSGMLVAQTHRTAKNLNTGLAMLDGLSEEINNHIFRKGHRALGLSAALAGSGMAFEYGLFRQLIASCHAVGGFDKELELELARSGVRVEYLDHITVWDEKVSISSVFVNQRRRWLSAQVHYLKTGLRQLIRIPPSRWTIDHIDKVVQMALPPRILLVALLPVAAVALFPVSNFAAGWFAALCLLNAITVGIALPRTDRRFEPIRAVRHLPVATYWMLVALIRLLGANKRFIHTAHGASEVSNNRRHR